MDMLRSGQVAEGGLTEWRKLARGLHARYLVADFGAGARFVLAVAEAGDAIGHRASRSAGGSSTSSS
jgi:4a-hydroxytetrahydrobiopterin dehydratase